MTIEKGLRERSENMCELCSSKANLSVYEVPPVTDPHEDRSVLLCDYCKGQIDNPKTMDPNHWRCLNETMWSVIPAVQVMAWRVLEELKSEGWAQDLIIQLYLEEDTLKWAKALQVDTDAVIVKDTNGAELKAGDTVTLIKDLDVKGAGFTAKRGTIVRKISLTDNPAHIEGRANGVQIVLLTCYLKKTN